MEGQYVLGLIKNAWITEEREYQGVKFRRLHTVFMNDAGTVLEVDFKISNSQIATLQMMLEVNELLKK